MKQAECEHGVYRFRLDALHLHLLWSAKKKRDLSTLEAYEQHLTANNECDIL